MSFERGFEEVERAAAGAATAAQTVNALANASGKAATEGDLPALDRTLEQPDST